MISFVGKHFLLIDLILLPFVFSLAWAAISMAPWVPTRKKDLERINDLADLKKGETFYELGCGDARVSLYLARKNPDVQIVAFELAFPLYLLARMRCFFSSVKNVQIKFADIFREDLSPADKIYVFAMKDSLNKKLKEKFLRELRSNTRIISYAFPMKKWGREIIFSKPSDKVSGIYVYEVK